MNDSAKEKFHIFTQASELKMQAVEFIEFANENVASFKNTK